MLEKYFQDFFQLYGESFSSKKPINKINIQIPKSNIKLTDEAKNSLKYHTEKMLAIMIKEVEKTIKN